MGWLDVAGAIGAGLVDGAEKGVSIRGQYDRGVAQRQENEQRKRKLDEEKKVMDQDAEVEADFVKQSQSKRSPALVQGAGAPTVDFPQDGPGMPSTPAAMAAAGGADVQQLPTVQVTAKADPLADYKARIDIARKKGYAAVAEKWQGRLTEALSQDVRQQALVFEQKYAPVVQEIKMAQADAERTNQPLKLDAERQKLLDEYNGLKRKAFATSMFDLASPVPELRQSAVATLSKGLGVDGVQDFKVVKIGGEQFFVPVDANGQGFPDPSKGGKEPLKFHRDDALEQASQVLGIDKQYIKLGEGETLVRPTRGGGVREVARGQPKNKTESKAHETTKVKQGVSDLAKAMGVALDTSGRLMEGVDENTRAAWIKGAAKVEQMITGGIPPQEAAAKVFDEFQRSKGAKPAAGGKPAPAGAGAIPEDVDALLR